MSNPKCRHTPVGRVAWPTGMPSRNEAHASTYVCARTECREDAARWVEHITGRRGEFVPFTKPNAASHPVTVPKVGQLNLFAHAEEPTA